MGDVERLFAAAGEHVSPGFQDSVDGEVEWTFQRVIVSYDIAFAQLHQFRDL